MLQPIKTALASFGMSGRVFHGPFLKAYDEYDVVKIFERSKEESKTMFPDAEIVRSFDSILNDPKIELVIINTPNYLHYEMTKQVLLAEKHVVVEKPFTTTVKEGEELIQLAEQKKLSLAVYHNRRWDSDFITIKKLIENGELGHVSHYEAHFDRHRPEIGPKKWKETQFDGAGIVYDLGSHLIDQALVLFGLPDEIDADIQIQRKNGTVPDYFKISLRYQDLDVILTAGMLVKNPGPKYIIKGEKGNFIKYGQDTQEQALINGFSPLDPHLGEEPQGLWGKLNGTSIPSVKGDYGLFYRRLYESIRENKKAPVLPTEALNVIKIIETAIKQSPVHPVS